MARMFCFDCDYARRVADDVDEVFFCMNKKSVRYMDEVEADLGTGCGCELKGD